MRAALVVAVIAAAAAAVSCRPDIGFGTYACGPNETCPTDQKCDETMDLCVDPPTAEAFACGGGDPEPDNDVSTATSLGELTCISAPLLVTSCLDTGDALDLVTFSTPATCTQVALNAALVYQQAFEELTLSLTGSDGSTVIATDVACPTGRPADDGELGHCVTAPLTPGSAYFLRVETSGSGDCGGKCGFNRYTLSVQITQ